VQGRECWRRREWKDKQQEEEKGERRTRRRK
jgi:hypothetical protein